MYEDTTTRRAFLKKGMTLAAVGATASLDRMSTVVASPCVTPLTMRASGKDGKILVIVQLTGGNDGLSTVVPYADDVYQKARPDLAFDARTVLKVNDYIGLHPNLVPLKSLFDDGRLSIIQGVGYPNPDRSHFRSMDIWHSGYPEMEIVTSGWVGRYFDNACTGCGPHVGVSVGDTLPLSMQGERITPLCFAKSDGYRYPGPEVYRYLQFNQTALDPAGKCDLNGLHRVATNAQLGSNGIVRMTRNHKPRVEYPRNKLGDGLRSIASMIAGGSETRVYYVSLGGFDTHQNQKSHHDNLMDQFAESVGTFWADLAEQRNGDRVLMMSFSEFGRRVEQNASRGTDDGAAAPMFLIGSCINPGVFGSHPSLTDLEHGGLKHNVDFRSVYATVLQDWLNSPSKPILGRQFQLMPIIQTRAMST